MRTGKLTLCKRKDTSSTVLAMIRGTTLQNKNKNKRGWGAPIEKSHAKFLEVNGIFPFTSMDCLWGPKWMNLRGSFLLM